MFTKTYFSKLLLFLFFACAFQSNIFAQDLNTFKMNIKNKEYTVSQDIDPSFLGIYSSGKGENRVQKNLTKEEGNTFEWGILVENGQFVTSEVMEYAGGKMVSYLSYTVIYKNTATGQSGEAMLYELDGKKHLDQAEKEEAVAENR